MSDETWEVLIQEGCKRMDGVSKISEPIIVHEGQIVWPS